MFRSRVCATAVVLLLVAGCGGGGSARRVAGSAVWLAPASRLDAANGAALEAAGVRELFLESGRLEWSGGKPTLAAVGLPDFPRRSLVTLVVNGVLPATADGAVGEQVGEAVRRLRLDREGQGLVVRGAHLDLALDRLDLGAYAGFLAGVRRKLGDGLYLSATIPRGWIGQSGMSDVASAVDTLVVMAYGQRPGELEDPDAWDLTVVRRLLRQVEELGTDYLVGIATLGQATHLDAGRRPLAATAAVASLRTVLLAPRLELGRGFSLVGVDRQTWELDAPRGARVGTWQVQAGEHVRVSRLASIHLQRYRSDLGREKLAHHLGEVYVRLPEPGEGLALGAENLVAGLGKSRPTPDLAAEISVSGRSGKRWRLRLRLSNRNQETSDLSQLDNNWVELSVERGQWGDVEEGGFARVETMRVTPEGTLEPTFRSPRVLRLYHPMVAGGETVESGDLELLAEGQPRVQIAGRFLLPDGELFDLPPTAWDGEDVKR
jgi:hypothetical protein